MRTGNLIGEEAGGGGGTRGAQRLRGWGFAPNPSSRPAKGCWKGQDPRSGGGVKNCTTFNLHGPEGKSIFP